MKSFVKITPDGRFGLDGKRWFCNSTIYFGHHPGAMIDWFTDKSWAINEPQLETDFARMANIGINHAALFLHNGMFFDGGKLLQKGFDRLDKVIQVAKSFNVRTTLFSGPFIDSEEEYFRITGEKWGDGDKWLPSFNKNLYDAYVAAITPLAKRYANEPGVLGYGDRIDRFHKGFDNKTIPHNLKEEWAGWLKNRYGSFKNFLDTVGGISVLENAPKDFNEVLLPQESKFNASLKNPMAYDYILMQKKEIGDAQARWDAETEKMAPNQVMWTPFEGNTNTWAMLDGFTPETKKLKAIWMEYYYFEVTRVGPVHDLDEWAHTPEMIHRRLSHELPVVYNAAYMMTRYLKMSVQQPVVICHGVQVGLPAQGAESLAHQTALMDRVNAACLAADGDGWHYWDWTDEYASSESHLAKQKATPTDYFNGGESMGIYDYEGHPRPVVSLLAQYSREVERRIKKNLPPKQSETLMLSSAPRMYNLFRRIAYATAAAVNGALARCGIEADYLWSAQNDHHIPQEWLDRYKLIVISDNMYERDFRDMPDKLLKYVEQGGTLVLPLDRWDSLKDEHGVVFESEAMSKLSGVDPKAEPNWPGAKRPCQNWPFPTEAAHEPNFDSQAFPRLFWGICPDFRHRSPLAYKTAFFAARSVDGDSVTIVPGLVEGAEVIAVGKYAAGSRPFLYRHRVGKGWVYVNTWTNNVYRDADGRQDYGGWEYDFFFALAAETAEVEDINLIGGSALWLRNSWGYFWKEM